jgi:ribosomal protein L13
LAVSRSRPRIFCGGKEKTLFTPHVDTGDFVIVVNAEKVRITGKKEEQKTFMSFSGYVGGINRKMSAHAGFGIRNC